MGNVNLLEKEKTWVIILGIGIIKWNAPNKQGYIQKLSIKNKQSHDSEKVWG